MGPEDRRRKPWYGEGLPYLRVGPLPGHLIVIEAEPRGDDAELELWAAARRTDLLARLLERPAILRQRASAEPAAVGLPASGAP